MAHPVDGDERDLRAACPTWARGCPTRSGRVSRTARTERRRAPRKAATPAAGGSAVRCTRSTTPPTPASKAAVSSASASHHAAQLPHRHGRGRRVDVADAGEERAGAPRVGRARPAWPRPRPGPKAALALTTKCRSNRRRTRGTMLRARATSSASLSVARSGRAATTSSTSCAVVEQLGQAVRRRAPSRAWPPSACWPPRWRRQGVARTAGTSGWSPKNVSSISLADAPGVRSP